VDGVPEPADSENIEGSDDSISICRIISVGRWRDLLCIHHV